MNVPFTPGEKIGLMESSETVTVAPVARSNAAITSRIGPPGMSNRNVWSCGAGAPPGELSSASAGTQRAMDQFKPRVREIAGGGGRGEPGQGRGRHHGAEGPERR